MYCLVFYVPKSHCEAVKNALFSKGAGRYEKYDRCAWQVEGEGQYRPLEGSNPFKGETDKIEREPEYKVEIMVKKEIIKEILETLITVHPYEEVAYYVTEVKTFSDV